MEYFEMWETSSKVQRTYYLKYWTIGIVYCTCGVCLLHSTQTQRLNQERFDILSIPNDIIKKKSYRGAKHGNSQIQRKYHKAEDCLRKAKKNHFTSILQRFQESETYRNSQLSHNWDEECCKELDHLALEDHSSTATAAERKRQERNCRYSK